MILVVQIFIMNKLSNKLHRALSRPVFSQSRPVTANHPSTASIKLEDRVVGECLRKLFYQYIDTAPTNVGEVDWKLAALMGDSFHELAVQLIVDHGYMMGLQVIGKEQSFYDEQYNISGRIDIIAHDIDENEVVGIEVKSVGEYKASKTMTMPDENHLLQAMIYLDWYDKHTASNSSKIKKWYIWYIARAEGWALKSKKHGSPFTQMWDFCIELEDGSPVIHTANGVKKLTEFNIAGIYDRYTQLDLYKTDVEIPPRDYEIAYSEEKILGMYKLGKLEYKKDIEAVEKWIKKGMEPGKLKLEMGDIECKFCPYSKTCWENFDNGRISKSFVEFKKHKNNTTKYDDSL